MKKETILKMELTDGQAALFYLGQEGFLVKYRGKYFLIDPYLSDYVDRNCCTEDVKWIRKYPAPIQAGELDFIDCVLCMHAHFDHADPDTLRVLGEVCPQAKFIVPRPIKELIGSYGIASERILGARADEALQLCGCEIVPVPSAHEELHQDAEGEYMELGYKLLLGDISLYHAGDCCVYDGLAGRIRNVDVCMVPINGRGYYKMRDDIVGNMTVEEAVLLAKESHAGLLVPMHFDLYGVNGVNPAHFVDCVCSIHPVQRFHIFAPGECYIVSAGA